MEFPLNEMEYQGLSLKSPISLQSNALIHITLSEASREPLLIGYKSVVRVTQFEH